jgi:hypothetical protein
VYENYKAWTQANANPFCISLEMCAYASWSRSTWMGKNVLLNNAADWLRYLTAKYGIPYTVLSNSQAQSGTVKGIAQHVNFGSMGSGHVDCGSGFPMDEVIKRARGSAPTPTTGGVYVPSTTTDSVGREWSAGIWEDGKVNICTPEGEWYAIDPTQSGAKGGADIYYNAGSDKLIVSYINGAGELCTYRKNPNAPRSEWEWRSRKGKLKG